MKSLAPLCFAAFFPTQTPADPQIEDKYAPADAIVALPQASDLPGYSDFAPYDGTKAMEGDARGRAYFSSSPRRAGGSGLRILVAIVREPTESARAAPGLVGFSGEPPPLKSSFGSFSGRRIGQMCAHNGNGAVTYACDGRVAIAVQILKRPVRMPDERFRGDTIARDEILLAENLLVNTLDRMTAMGFTSKPAGRASSGARRQVALRLKVLRQAAAQKPPTDANARP